MEKFFLCYFTGTQSKNLDSFMCSEKPPNMRRGIFSVKNICGVDYEQQFPIYENDSLTAPSLASTYLCDVIVQRKTDSSQWCKMSTYNYIIPLYTQYAFLCHPSILPALLIIECLVLGERDSL